MNNLYDVIIVGAGPAGLSAAIYLARARFSVLVLEKETIGGQITITDEIVNYPGVVKTSGSELTNQMRIQAENFGAEFLIAEVTNMEMNQAIKTVQTNLGEFKSIGLLLATGANPRTLGFEGEQEFKGRGVAYCATCDGEFFTDLDVFVIGGGFAAAEEALFLTKYARRVRVIVREEDFTCARSIADKVRANEKIEVYYESEIIEAGGENQLQYARFRDNKSDKIWRYDVEGKPTFGIFVFAGYEPATLLFKEQVTLDDQQYLVTDENQKTNVDGVYGAGDLCIKNLRQVATAVSDGAIAATSLERYVPPIVETQKLKTRKQITQHTSEENNTEDTVDFISSDMKNQLVPILERLTKKVVIKAHLSDNKLSKEIESFLIEFVAISNNIRYTIDRVQEGYPYMALYDEEDNYLRIKYYAVPGGHEFNSFVIALYNAAGPKQKIDEQILDDVKKLSKKQNIKVMVSLSCTKCPEVVMATQRIALENELVEAEVFDLSHFPEIKERYNIMSVPCMIINDQDVYFGKKNISEITTLLR